MAGPEFFQTPMGKRFFEGTLPQIAQSLEKIAKNLEEDPEIVDTSQLKDPYIRLDIPDSNLYVEVKLDDEGVTIDIFNKDDPDAIANAIASTGKLYEEMAEDESD